VDNLGPIPFAPFLEFYFAFDELPVLSGPVVGALALRAREFYELKLGHVEFCFPTNRRD